jgi:hypothetical protein
MYAVCNAPALLQSLQPIYTTRPAFRHVTVHRVRYVAICPARRISHRTPSTPAGLRRHARWHRRPARRSQKNPRCAPAVRPRLARFLPPHMCTARPCYNYWRSTTAHSVPASRPRPISRHTVAHCADPHQWLQIDLRTRSLVVPDQHCPWLSATSMYCLVLDLRPR